MSWSRLRWALGGFILVTFSMLFFVIAWVGEEFGKMAAFWTAWTYFGMGFAIIMAAE